MVNININFSNKILYLLIAVLALLAVTGVAIALNSGDYTVHGHDLGEIPTCAEGEILKMSGGAWTCGSDSSGGGGGTIQFYDCVWIDIYSKSCGGVPGCYIVGNRVVLDQNGPYVVTGLNHNSPEYGDAFKVCKIRIV
tara:strand:+ start:296 stop:709 length:414 start_codon:yes stop_codon:yes gene_type:complete